MPPVAGDLFGLGDVYLNITNPSPSVSYVEINSTATGAGVTVTSGVLDTTAGIATLTTSTSAGVSTGAKIAVSGLSIAGVACAGYNGVFVVTGSTPTTVSYATTGYVGTVSPSISTTGQVTLVTDTAIQFSAWSGNQSHGWFGGGTTTTIVATVERIDFSNDSATASPRGPLSLARNSLAATGNSNYGWFGGGFAPSLPGRVSTVERIDFSNDSATASVRGPLSLARTYSAATANSNYGWFGGGSGTFPIIYSTVDRIDFSNDSGTASLRGPLTLGFGRIQFAATGNSNYGWFGGGFPAISRVDRIDFSNDFITASVRGPLSSGRYNFAATGNSNYGWFGGGYVPGLTATVDRIDFSNDSATASVRGPLSLARTFSAATANSNYGWFGGGYASGPSVYSRVDRIDFSNDSATASPRGPLSLSRYNSAATSGQARSSSIRLQKTGSYGWFGGGYSNPSLTNPGATRHSTVDRIDFANDSVSASPRGALSGSKYFLAATGNSNYGWFGGGFPGSVGTSIVDRIDFSNDSGTASVRGPLSVARLGLAATANSNYGWFGGGFVPSLPGRVSTVNRIDFSNDSPTASVRGSLSLEKTGLAATANSNYGWFGGGSNSTPAVVSTVDRIDFSNDSATASPRGPLSLVRSSLAATGNSNYGWFGGGNTGVSPSFTQHMSTVDRIDFSNDSATVSVRSPLLQARYSPGATGNSNYGWFGGGGSMPAGTFPYYTSYSTVERINFSNDLAATSPRGPLFQARYALAAT